MNSVEKSSNQSPSGEYQEQSEKPKILENAPVDIPQEYRRGNAVHVEERQKADVAKIAELREEILSPIGKNEGNKNELGIDIDPSLKTRGVDFANALQRVYGRLDSIDKEAANIVSPGTLDKFRSVARNLEDAFQGKKLDLSETSNALNRLTGAFEDLSLMNDRELRKITEDAKRSLIAAIADAKDSATSVRAVESAAQLSRNINKLVSKADEAAFRLRKSLR